MRRLLRATGTPLAAPSANPFGRLSPTTAARVDTGLGDRIPWILDGGPCEVGVESTIVDLSDPKHPRILRPGGIPAAAIALALGTRVSIFQGAANTTAAQKAPGMLKQHYSPLTPLVLHRRLGATRVRRGGPLEAFLFFRKPSALIIASHPNVSWLSVRGSHTVAARRLFAALHALDSRGFEVINAELAPGLHTGAAVNDRLRRAAAKG
jgi:L-threonylcarbamoyladenylate synthase